MSKKFLFAAIFTVSIFAALFAACGNRANSVTAEKPTASTDTNSASTDAERAPNAEGSFKIDFKSEPGAIQAGQPATLAFTVRDKQGALVKDLQIVHEKPMHLLVVSRDLAEFYHIHPEQSADGSYRVAHTFPNGGEYKLYADFTPPGAAQVVERIDVKVGGTERAKVPLAPDAKFERTVDNLRVEMKPDAEIKAGKELMLNFQVFDAASNKPATDLQNYLGELAHFVIVSEDMQDFVHAHPMSKGKKTDDMKMDGNANGDHNADGHSHSTTESPTTRPSASEVSAHTAFPRAGLYKIWAQFQRGGQVITVPFVVNVRGGEQKAEVKPANVPAGAVQVTVSASGYSPASIPVKKGEAVKLSFYRAEAEGCGDEVVFAKQNIRKKLPVGETVMVEFTPTEVGEITFACGMNMLRGKIVVGEN